MSAGAWNRLLCNVKDIMLHIGTYRGGSALVAKYACNLQIGHGFAGTVCTTQSNVDRDSGHKRVLAPKRVLRWKM
jgi:hypothetical protein